MNVTKTVRRESLEKTKPKFSAQEQRVRQSIQAGHTNAWTIAQDVGMLITSVRRSLHSLTKRKEIVPIGWTVYAPTNRKITVYAITPTN